NEVGGIVRAAAEQDRRRLRAGIAMRAAAVAHLTGDAERRVLEEEVGIGEVDADLFGILVGAADAEENAVAVGDQDVAVAVLDRRDLVADTGAQQDCGTVGVFGTESEIPAVTIVEIEHLTDATGAASRTDSRNIAEPAPVLPLDGAQDRPAWSHHL